MRALSCLFSTTSLRAVLGALLLCGLLAGCASEKKSSDDDDGADGCYAAEDESVPATFTHSVSSGVLNLGISQSGGGALAVVYCVPVPHGGNYHGIQADMAFDSSTVSQSDVDLFMDLYESNNGYVVLTELILEH